MSFPEPPPQPEIPYPFPPMRERPERREPALVPMVEMPGPAVSQQLRERRIAMLSGPLDSAEAVRLCAEMMTFDGTSDERVDLVINSPGGPVAEVSAVLDVIGAMRAPVATRCVGTAGGTAAVLLACGTGRRVAAAHASVSLRCDQRESMEGAATDLARRAEDLRRHLDRLAHAVAAASTLEADDVLDQLRDGGVYDAEGARAAGLVDEVLRPRRDGRRSES